jgi:hypothetical protein
MSRVERLENRFSQDQIVTGIELVEWMKLLRGAEWAPNLDYLHRFAQITGISLATTALGRVEDMLYARELANVEIDPTPLFVIGHWRSGTTHMHDLLGRDPNHSYTSVWQVIFPTVFLSASGLGPRLLAGALPKKRTYDNMRMGWDEPAEDEIALFKLHGMSFYGAVLFPDAHAKYERYIDFLECTEAERDEWKRTLKWFIKKVMLHNGGKRVIIKSCPHSARIRMLLDLFPDAKFVHIHRDPYRVFASMMHMRGKVDWENFMQRPDKGFLALRREQTADVGQRLFTRLIEDRALIPEGNLYEVGYDEFCGNELEHLERIYTQFDLPGWARFQRRVVPYLEAQKGYQTNRLRIDAETRALVEDRWGIVFDTYGYARESAK